MMMMIRRHRFRMQFIQCNNSCFLLGKDYEDHGTNILCQPEESATLYKHCNRIRPFSFQDRTSDIISLFRSLYSQVLIYTAESTEAS